MVFVCERIIFNLLISLCFINEYKQGIYVSRYHRVQLGSGDVGQARFHLRLGFRSTMMSSSYVENILFLFILFLNLQKGLLSVHRMGEGEENGVCIQPTFEFYEMGKNVNETIQNPQGINFFGF